MNRPFEFVPGEYYHIYHRGNDRRETFLEDADFSRFILLLYTCNSFPKPLHISNHNKLSFSELMNLKRGEQLVDIGAYCLMPNHYHLLIKAIKKEGVSLFIQKLATAYAMYFNKKYSRTGSIFEKPFRARYVDTDRYLRYLYSYIHLNPVKKKVGIDAWSKKFIPNPKEAKKFLAEYRFSSHLDYVGAERLSGKVLNKESFPQYFRTAKDFSDYTDDWQSYNEVPNVKVKP